jgi:hypothetical protein
MRFGQICAPLVRKDAKNSPWLKQERTRDTLSKYDVSYSHHPLVTLHSREWRKSIKNYLFKNLSNTAILIVLYLSKHLHICVIFNILYFKINCLVSCLIGGIWQDLGPRLIPVFDVGSYYSITFLRNWFFYGDYSVNMKIKHGSYSLLLLAYSGKIKYKSWR